jgi:hypothetical protein
MGTSGTVIVDKGEGPSPAPASRAGLLFSTILCEFKKFSTHNY